jgi:hypothetical protein
MFETGDDILVRGFGKSCDKDNNDRRKRNAATAVMESTSNTNI